MELDLSAQSQCSFSCLSTAGDFVPERIRHIAEKIETPGREMNRHLQKWCILRSSLMSWHISVPARETSEPESSRKSVTLLFWIFLSSSVSGFPAMARRRCVVSWDPYLMPTSCSKVLASWIKNLNDVALSQILGTQQIRRKTTGTSIINTSKDRLQQSSTFYQLSYTFESGGKRFSLAS